MSRKPVIIYEQENTGWKNFQIGWREKGKKSVRIKADISLSTMKELKAILSNQMEVLESKTKNDDIIQQKLKHSKEKKCKNCLQQTRKCRYLITRRFWKGKFTWQYEKAKCKNYLDFDADGLLEIQKVFRINSFVDQTFNK